MLLNRIERDKDWDRFDNFYEIERKKYFAGFKLGEDKHMFKEELKDLESVYRHALNETDRELECWTHSLIPYMEEFVKLHKQKETINGKLDVLMQKTGGDKQQDGEEDDCA